MVSLRTGDQANLTAELGPIADWQVSENELGNFRGGANSTEASELAERRYISAVYFHTLFLYATTKSRHYELTQCEEQKRVEVTVVEYVSDLFSSAYAQFLLNFDTADLMETLG